MNIIEDLGLAINRVLECGVNRHDLVIVTTQAKADELVNAFAGKLKFYEDTEGSSWLGWNPWPDLVDRLGFRFIMRFMDIPVYAADDYPPGCAQVCSVDDFLQ